MQSGSVKKYQTYDMSTKAQEGFIILHNNSTCTFH